MVHQTSAAYCDCNCCVTKGCTPRKVESRYLWSCTLATCTPEKCVEWFYDRCPARDAPGSTTARCNGTERLLSSLSIVIGITSIILMIKNKF
jgi:hypothetical protein